MYCIVLYEEEETRKFPSSSSLGEALFFISFMHQIQALAMMAEASTSLESAQVLKDAFFCDGLLGRRGGDGGGGMSGMKKKIICKKLHTYSIIPVPRDCTGQFFFGALRMDALNIIELGVFAKGLHLFSFEGGGGVQGGKLVHLWLMGQQSGSRAPVLAHRVAWCSTILQVEWAGVGSWLQRVYGGLPSILPGLLSPRDRRRR